MIYCQQSLAATHKVTGYTVNTWGTSGFYDRYSTIFWTFWGISLPEAKSILPETPGEAGHEHGGSGSLRKSFRIGQNVAPEPRLQLQDG